MDDQVFTSFNRQVRPRNTALLALLRGAVLFLALLAVPGHAQTVTMTIDAAQSVKPISRYIYGINYGNNAPLDPALGITIRRMGGNRWTAYNWENNASNAGSDFNFQNDDYLGGGNTPGGALIPAINDAHAKSAALLATVPINGYVAFDKNGGGDVRNSGPNYLQTRFRQDIAVKGAPFTVTPDPADPYVYQDEFVNWVKMTFPYSQQAGTLSPIWFCLDNEPDLWQETHPEVHPGAPLYSELVSKGTAYAAAIKAVAPNTLVFGPVSYGWNGYVTLQNAPDAGGRDFLNFYLSQMKTASDTAGKRLLDALDLHWYPEAQSSDGIRITGTQTTATVVAARLQAPRSLWDPSYVEKSWIAQDWLGNHAINLLPLMMGKIATNYPGTQLAFTEYNYGAGQHISGGIAQADVLGIFGRYGVFAATQWPLQENGDGTPAEPFVGGAFRMYRNFDGRGGSFGDTSVFAQTNDIPDTSVYASLDSTNAKRMVLVVINKTANPITAVVNLNNAPAFKQAAIYQLTSASAQPVANGTMLLSNPAQFNYNMPAYSVSTLNLTASSTHDFNGDGRSDILLENTGGGIAMWLMGANATVASAVAVGSTTPNVWTVIGQRDLNGDGNADILFRATDGSIGEWLMNGNGTVMSANGLGNPTTAWTIVGTGDFNKDGIGDVLFRGGGTAVAIWYMSSSGGLSSAVGVGSLPIDWTVAGTGDFNGDGVWDILWLNSTSKGVAAWLMNANGTVKGAVPVGSLPAGWSIAGTGDFNGDGIGDILLSNTGNGVAIWFMNASGGIGSAQGVGTLASGWTIAQTGDFNGDRKSDVLLYHSSGTIGAWLMDAATVTSFVGIGSLPPSAWTILTANSE